LLSYEEALARLLEGASPRPSQLVPPAEAAGRYLAAPLVSHVMQPPFDCSAMDGYAVRHEDLPGPWRVVGQSAAGSPCDETIGTCEAVRIFTGAALPAGADTIVIQEETERQGNTLRLRTAGPQRRGQHVRRAGFDFAAGATLATAGALVTPALAGLCAASGNSTLEVHSRPRVVLVASGDELVLPGDALAPGQIYASNGVMLSVLLAQAGALVTDRSVVPDRLEALTAAIGDAAGADLLVTIGGASVGDHDLIKPALEAAGATIDFWKIALRPGKPMLAGRLGTTLLVGLPGNSVSAFVCAHLFLLPMVRRLSGCPRPVREPLLAASATELPANGARRDHLRATLSHTAAGLSVEAADAQDSAGLRVLAGSNALLIRPPHAPPVEPGQLVPVLPLDTSWNIT
jgi:molybdopterin molybdotransferase